MLLKYIIFYRQDAYFLRPTKNSSDNFWQYSVKHSNKKLSRADSNIVPTQKSFQNDINTYGTTSTPIYKSSYSVPLNPYGIDSGNNQNIKTNSVQFNKKLANDINEFNPNHNKNPNVKRLYVKEKNSPNITHIPYNPTKCKMPLETNPSVISTQTIDSSFHSRYFNNEAENIETEELEEYEPTISEKNSIQTINTFVGFETDDSDIHSIDGKIYEKDYSSFVQNSLKNSEIQEQISYIDIFKNLDPIDSPSKIKKVNKSFCKSLETKSSYINTSKTIKSPVQENLEKYQMPIKTATTPSTWIKTNISSIYDIKGQIIDESYESKTLPSFNSSMIKRVHPQIFSKIESNLNNLPTLNPIIFDHKKTNSIHSTPTITYRSTVHSDSSMNYRNTVLTSGRSIQKQYNIAESPSLNKVNGSFHYANVFLKTLIGVQEPKNKCQCTKRLTDSGTCNKALNWLSFKYKAEEFPYLKQTYERILNNDELKISDNEVQIKKDLHRTHPEWKYINEAYEGYFIKNN